MSATGYVRLLDLASGAFLLAAAGVLWRRDLAAIVRLLAAQGGALAGLVAILGAHQRDATEIAVAGGVLALRAALLPALMRRALAAGGEGRETSPRVNVAVSLLIAAGLMLLAYAAARPLISLSPSPAMRALPAALAVVLIGFFVMVARRRALSQVAGFLLIDNGITATAFLTSAGVPLIVELGVSLDLLLAVGVLQVLTARMRAAFGGTDLDDLRELRD